MTKPALIGSAPDSWGVWYADDPKQTPRKVDLNTAVRSNTSICCTERPVASSLSNRSINCRISASWARKISQGTGWAFF